MAISWIKYVTKFYHDKKKANPAYQFKQALKDAAAARKNITRKVSRVVSKKVRRTRSVMTRSKSARSLDRTKKNRSKK